MLLFRLLATAEGSHFLEEMKPQAAFTLLCFHFYPFLLMKTLPVHIAPFSNKYAMITIGNHITPCSGYYQRKSFGFSPEEPDASRSALESAQYRSEGHRPSSFLC